MAPEPTNPVIRVGWRGFVLGRLRNFRMCAAALTGVLALVAALCGSAAATPLQLEIRWTGTTSTSAESLASLGTADYVGRPGDIATAELVFSIDPGVFISTYATSIQFDAEGLDQLDIVTISSLPFIVIPPGLFWGQHVTPEGEESSLGRAGLVTSFSHQTFEDLPLGPFTVPVGTVDFLLTDALTAEGTVVTAGNFKVGRDGWLDVNLDYRLDGFTFVPGSVRLVPEPSAALLLVIGLLGLGLQRGPVQSP